MTTLAIALAQSPSRAASATVNATASTATIEVRALITDRHLSQPGGHAQQTWTRQMRYELLINGSPAVTGSYSDVLRSVAAMRDATALDWQPVIEHAAVAPAKQMRWWNR